LKGNYDYGRNGTYSQRHKVLDIIIIAVTAIFCGMDTWNEIADWACSRKE
jgi:hypothetical protein